MSSGFMTPVRSAASARLCIKSFSAARSSAPSEYSITRCGIAGCLYLNLSKALRLLRKAATLFSDLPFEHGSALDDRTHGDNILDGFVSNFQNIVRENDHIGIFAGLDRSSFIFCKRIT